MEPSEHARAVDAAVKSFNQFIDESILETTVRLGKSSEGRRVVPHLKTLAVEMRIIFSKDEKYQFFNNSIPRVSDYFFHLTRLGQLCCNVCEIFSAKEYFSAAIKLIEGREECDYKDLARGFYYLGLVNHDLCNLQEAKEYLQHAQSL